MFLTLAANLTACNNRSINRLSALNVCKGDGPESDPASFTLSEDQSKVLEAVAPEDFPDTEHLVVTSVVTTVDIELENEKKATFTLGNGNVRGNPTAMGVNCIRNLSLEDRPTTVSFNTPLTNENGQVTYQVTTLSFGNPTKEDLSDFVRVSTEAFTPPKENNTDIDSDESEEKEKTTATAKEETPKASPAPFSSHFSADGDQTSYYQAKRSEKEKEKKEDNTYYIHYKNDAQKIRSRITVTKIVPKEDKK